MLLTEGMVSSYPPHPPAPGYGRYCTSLGAACVVIRILRPATLNRHHPKLYMPINIYILCFSKLPIHVELPRGLTTLWSSFSHNLRSPVLQSVPHPQYSTHNGHHCSEDDTGSRGSKQGNGSVIRGLASLAAVSHQSGTLCVFFCNRTRTSQAAAFIFLSSIFSCHCWS